jgi:predicted RNA polymerase sigma factor
LLNRAVAIAMLQGPRAGLTLIDDLAEDLTAYLSAARKTTSLPEQRYLNARAARLRTYS